MNTGQKTRQPPKTVDGHCRPIEAVLSPWRTQSYHAKLPKTFAKPPTGIRRRGDTWRAWVRVDGRLRSQTFPGDTPLGAIQAWRAAQRAPDYVDGRGVRLSDKERALVLARVERVLFDFDVRNPEREAILDRLREAL